MWQSQNCQAISLVEQVQIFQQKHYFFMAMKSLHGLKSSTQNHYKHFTTELSFASIYFSPEYIR